MNNAAKKNKVRHIRMFWLRALNLNISLKISRIKPISNAISIEEQPPGRFRNVEKFLAADTL